MPTPDVEPGLRERKRRATRRAIQLAAIDLVAEHGLDGTTVDEISRRADVSPRTFFNYFPSKEAAVIGDHPSLPEGAPLEEFLAAGPGEPIMTGIARIIAGTIAGDDHDHELMVRRKTVLGEYPQLFALRMANMRRVEEQLADLIAERLTMDVPALAGRPDELRSRAHLTAFVAFGAIRHAWSQWAAGRANGDLPDVVTASFAALPEVVA
ncbi:AcrR family transcriptional regulator [Microbacteriaceae bacterium SG_E_30_P1]|uniref:AcrR family transcriptional regulator n=1 Tax=Antiquaquibacter oligotrophicus TaxID=2880260 RepID=A0ABT6KPA8_9MICO|nr:TetR family transcriptional regulator [Antiquaquibacter oligotrophicus]MDH6181829.1 AcrR family transcriptional regulator [Antiquaquibacter oligotrophicus]UDF12494.1 TetR/AcrR family transcriptional regulator [Antiquaquibacter oligotrophicus]